MFWHLMYEFNPLLTLLIFLASRFSEELLTLARKYRMNTDSKKVIFCTVMSANDYMDAFEKLCKLKIKSPLKEEETSFVLTKLCVKEPQFNPFYPHVASKLARSDRKFRMSIQCAIWDRTRACINEEKKKSQACVNLGTIHILRNHFFRGEGSDGILTAEFFIVICINIWQF